MLLSKKDFLTLKTFLDHLESLRLNDWIHLIRPMFCFLLLQLMPCFPFLLVYNVLISYTVPGAFSWVLLPLCPVSAVKPCSHPPAFPLSPWTINNYAIYQQLSLRSFAFFTIANLFLQFKGFLTSNPSPPPPPCFVHYKLVFLQAGQENKPRIYLELRQIKQNL